MGKEVPIGKTVTDLPDQNYALGPKKSLSLEEAVQKEILPRLVKLVEGDLTGGKLEFLQKVNSTIKDMDMSKNQKFDLPDLLNRLQEALKDTNVPLHKEIAGKAVIINERIDAYQQVNSRLEGTGETYFIVQSLADPGSPGGAYEMIVKLKKEETKEGINYNHCQVVVSLNTINMGLVKAVARVEGKGLTCRLMVESDVVRTKVDKEASRLRDRLKQLGFNVVVYPAELVSTDKGQDLQKNLGIDGDLPKVGKVDVRI